MIKGALLGAGIGIGITVVHGYQDDEPVDTIANRAMKGAAVGAVGGATAGWMLGRVTRSKVVQGADTLVTPGPDNAIARVARVAAPAVGSAGELFTSAAEQAKPYVGRAAELTRKEAKQAAEVARREAKQAARAARKQALQAVEQARPYLEHAAEVARQQAKKTAKRAESQAKVSANDLLSKLSDGQVILEHPILVTT
jgi:hypothetical protein